MRTGIWHAPTTFRRKWAESLTAFREVQRLDPSWIENHVKPYVDEIERKTAAATIH